ncbi:MAG: response regulator [Acidobacteriota bacterium]
MPHILVVDDNVDNRNILTRLLAFGGYDTLTANNGAEALDRALDAQPDLVLMDLAMPQMDGWTATAAFKRDGRLAAIPIIAVTGHVTRHEIERAQSAGCHDLVSKPIDYYVLMDKIATHLGNSAKPPAADGGTGGFPCPA